MCRVLVDKRECLYGEISVEDGRYRERLTKGPCFQGKTGCERLPFELLANNVFAKCKTDFLVNKGMPSHLAEKTVEDERQRHKTDARFLVHDGLNDFMSRSLLTENKLLYDDIIKVQKLRHQVAHAGEKPSTEQARAALRKCCEAVGWLGQVVGVEVKPFLPEPADVANKFEFVA